MSGSVWRVPGMGWLLGSVTLWISGFALLLPAAPLWVIHGGSDDLGAVATATSYSAAFSGLALAAAVVGGYWARPIRVRRPGRPPIPR